MPDRSPHEIQREIEQAREMLAGSVDQLVYRVNPKRLSEQVLGTLKQKANSPQGRAVLGGAGLVVVLLVVRRVRKH